MGVFQRTSLWMNVVSGSIPLLALLAVPFAVRGEVLYSNDFSVRTSADPVPRAGWFVKNYTWPSALSYGYGEQNYTPLSPYDDPSHLQDGWAKIVATNIGLQNVNFWVRSNEDSSNPMGVFSNQSGKYGSQEQIMAVQTLHNAFSNGVLRFSVDIRAPGKKTPNGSYFRVKPLFANRTSPGSTAYAPYVLSFGPSNAGETLQVIGSDGNWAGSPTASAGITYEGVQRSHWYRYEVDLNLDTSKYSAKIYDLGTPQPAPDTATPATAVANCSGKSLYRRVAEQGPVCGIGLHSLSMSAYSARSSTENTLVYTNAVCVDNLRVWWKPTGSAAAFGEDNLVYENDFATRRFRSVQGTTSSTATADSLAVPASDTYTHWGACETNKVNVNRNFMEPGVTGRDGWKSMHWTQGNCTVADMEDAGGNALAFVTSNDYIKVSHRIGRRITSGKVKFEGDLRLPHKWNGNTSRTFTLCLGDDTLDSGENVGYAIRVGVSGVKDNADAFYPYTYTEQSIARTASDVTLTSNNWYRVRVVADLSTSTYDWFLYDLGPQAGGFDRTEPETPVYSRTNVGFYLNNGLTEFTKFAIYAYASWTTWKGAEVVDNLRVSVGTDGVNWTPVYENDFTTRVRYGARTTPEAKLLDKDVNRAGLDNWMRRGKYDGDWIVRDMGNGNPCLAFEDEQNIAHAQHMLGKPVVNGRLKMRVDMRPPTRHTDYSAQLARFYVGGDEYAQGELGTNSSVHATLRKFDNTVVGYFGFARAGESSSFGFYSRAKLTAYDGTTHSDYVISGDARYNWYRFLATFDVGRLKWRLDVYNQGTTRPTLDSPNGTLVKSFTDLNFWNVDPAGISAFGLAAGASSGTQPHTADTYGLLVDNIVIERVPSGTLLIVR